MTVKTKIYPPLFLKKWDGAKEKNKKKRGVYLDYAATTPIDPKVLKAMMPYLKDDYGNASSIHALGQKALIAIDRARDQVAEFLNCQAEEIIFTGSATEANNLAIKGIIEGFKLQDSSFKPHIITSQIEHDAVLEPCRQLEKKGVEVTYLPVNKQGLVSVADIEKAIKPQTILISIMYANNEIGTIEPIAEIGKLIKEINSHCQKSKVIFHTDAVQAINYLDCDVQKLGVDLLTLSGHKIYGPKGIGVLFVRKGTTIEPQILGGGHEFGLRSGTENVPGIVGLGQAVVEVRLQQTMLQQTMEKLRDRLINGILKNIPDSQLNGSRTKRLCNNINISFKGVEGEAMVIALDQEGIAVSTGSACSSKSLESSHVLLALGLSHEQTHGSLRITLGKDTTEKEIDKVLKILPKVVQRLRQISGYS
ncbi:MAG: cysteine desulfurase [Candidatus Pacebacteria bacterium]|nr:cysteine desulfurase [Candidatus Paceibacterota bacterium]